MSIGADLTALGTTFSLSLSSCVEIVNERPVGSGTGTGMGEVS